MTKRERLVELLREVDNMRLMRCGYKECADHILADGWMRLPCKVGDTIYKVMDLESVHKQILEVKVLRITIEDTISIAFKTVKKYRFRYGGCSVDDFGKTVFLSREEAEKALLGGDDDGENT